MKQYFAIAATWLAAAAHLAGATVYFNDFEAAVGPGWAITAGGGSLGLDSEAIAGSFLGLDDPIPVGGFNNNTVQLMLGSLPTHSSLTVSFNFLQIHSLDGGINCCGPDYFVFSLPGVFARTTTFGGPTQAFPNFIETGGSPSDNPDHFGGIPGTDTYSYLVSFTIPHTTDSAVLQFSMSGLQDITDEGWGLDNVRVETDTVVPEPGSLWMLCLGLPVLRILRRKPR